MFSKILLIVFVLHSMFQDEEARELTLEDFQDIGSGSGDEDPISFSELARQRGLSELMISRLEATLSPKDYKNPWHIGKHDEAVDQLLEDIKYHTEGREQRNKEELQLKADYEAGKISKEELDGALMAYQKEACQRSSRRRKC